MNKASAPGARSEPAVPLDTDYETLVSQSTDTGERVALTARWVLQDFDDYYVESRRIPYRVKEAFEKRDHKTTVALSKRRITIYSEHIDELGPKVKRAFPQLAEREELGQQVESKYRAMIHGRYEADFAFAYLHSTMRKVNQGEWKPVEYSFGETAGPKVDNTSEVYATYPVNGPVSAELIDEILEIPQFNLHYKARRDDAVLVAARVNETLAAETGEAAYLHSIEVVKAGFYRNRGVYLVGRVLLRETIRPFVVALLNDPDGIYVDAVLMKEADAHNLFSSTLASFHVTNSYYHELSAFLFSIMPHRPVGLHYSTLGFHHVGKVAVMGELKAEMEENGEVFEISVGSPGTVAIGFASASSAYNLKVIRDKPTDQYKWGEFQGIDAVLDKYRQIHEINRTGSMMDNVIFYNLRLHKDLFKPVLLQQLLMEAGRSVALKGSYVVFKHLIAQMKIVPLTVYLETASEEDAARAVVNLGYTIKNNAAANIFNKDLDARNYGVGVFWKVFLFDYDAVEPLTEVKIRSNEGKIEGEEDIPEWYFEDGVVFLPEEIEAGLLLNNRDLRRYFREVHPELLTTDYWESIQSQLRAGRVPSVQTYPVERCIR